MELTSPSRWKRTASGIVVPIRELTTPFAANFLTSGGPAVPSNIGVENTWHDIDLRDGAHWGGFDPGLPNAESIKAIRFDGIMIITHDGAPGTVEIKIALRTGEFEDTMHAGNYQLQTIEHEAGGGMRVPASRLVPVRNGFWGIHWVRNATFSAGFNFKITEVHY